MAILVLSHLDIETTQSFLDNPSGPQLNAIKYNFMTWIWLLFRSTDVLPYSIPP